MLATTLVTVHAITINHGGVHLRLAEVQEGNPYPTKFLAGTHFCVSFPPEFEGIKLGSVLKLELTPVVL